MRFAELEAQRPTASVKVHAVVGDPPAGCVSVMAAADVGAILEVQEMTSGRRGPFAPWIMGPCWPESPWM